MNIIDNTSSKFRLSEIGHGQREVQFAFINPETGETITPFCRCKDYFNDMFFAKKTGISVNICGFKWNKDDDNGILDKDELAIAVRLRDRDDHNFHDITKEEVESVFSLLNKFTLVNDFGHLAVELSDDNKYIIIRFSRKWIDIPYLCSTFFLLVRLGFTYKKDEDILVWYQSGSKNFISPNDENYFRSRKNRLKDLLEGKIDNNQNYEMYNKVNIHNCSGIVGYKEYKI